MRKIYALTTCAWLSLSQISWASHIFEPGQHTLAAAQKVPKITLKRSNVTLEELLIEIQRVTGISILYRFEQVEGIKNLSINWKEEPTFEVLGRLLKTKDISYRISGNTFILAKNDTAVVQKNASFSNERQQYYVSGYVYDDKQQPVRGASISLIKTSVQTSTDEKGFFRAPMPYKTGELTISFVGFQEQVITVESDQNLNIKLTPVLALINDVIVTGYQEINRERMTGSVSTIKAADIEGKGYGSIDEILIGQISGLSGIQSGRPGEDARIQIRGVNSLTGNTEPIWIVDGMPMQGGIPIIRNGATDLQSAIFTTGIGNLSPDDIESITVLKDAAATAIYGARAANGVIVVKSKSGTIGKTRFTGSLNYGLKERPKNNIAMMNSAQKIKFESDLYKRINFRETGRVGEILQIRDLGRLSDEDAAMLLDELSQTNTDWFKEIFRTALTQQYSFSMSGGTEKTQYYMSANHSNEHGVQPNNTFKRSGMSIKLNHDPLPNLRITAALGANLKNDKVTGSIIDPLQYALYANTYEKPYNEDGSLAYDLSYDMTQSILRPGLAWPKFNALDDMHRNTNSNRYINSDVSLKLEYEIIPGLQFETNGIYNINSNNSRKIEGENTYTNFRKNWYSFKPELPPDFVRGSLREGSAYADMYSLRNSLSFNKSIEQAHYLNVMVGQEISQTKGYDSYNFSPVFDLDHRVVGFPEIQGVDPLSINFASLGGTGMGVQKFSSFYSNGSYSYKDRFIFSGSLRYDGSDIIGNENQFTPLWNVSGRWNVHKERFLAKTTWLDEFSLRTSYGYTGSIDNNAFPFVVIRYNAAELYDEQIIPSTFDHANPNVKWQTKRDINFGANLAFLDRRIELGVNYYYNNTRDVLDQHNLPISSGRQQSTENIADLLNKGLEVDLGITLAKKKEFNWILSGNLTVNKNTLSKTYYQTPSDLPLRTHEQALTVIENYPAWSWFGYQFAGVEPLNGHVLIHAQDESLFDMELLRNKTLNLPIPEPSYLGKSIPTIFGGFGTNIRLKQFVFAANFEFKAGHMIPSFNTFKPLNSKNRHINDVTNWQQVGDITNVPEISMLNTAFGKYMYDVRLEKGDYLRASLFTLGYNLKPSILNKMKFYTARVSVNARDLFTLTAYNGIDPSLMGKIGYPNSRSYSLSLNVGF